MQLFSYVNLLKYSLHTYLLVRCILSAKICVRYIFFNVYFAAEIKNKHCWKMKWKQNI